MIIVSQERLDLGALSDPRLKRKDKGMLTNNL